MIREALTKIEEMCLRGLAHRDIDGKTYSPAKLDLTELKKSEHVEPDEFEFATLTGLVDFVEGDNVPSLEDETVIGAAKLIKYVHIESPGKVVCVGALQPDNDNEYFEWAEALFKPIKYEFENYKLLEHFLIEIASRFVQTNYTDAILAMLGNMANERVVKNEDDGLSQSIEIKTGLTTKSEIKVQNPVSLKPYRTFLECEQPESDFIMRLRGAGDDLKCALFQGDGGLWELTAIKNVKKWLEQEFSERGISGVRILA